jgi:hypothetical protein
MFECPKTGKLFKTKSGALKSAKRETERLAVIEAERKKAAIPDERREEMSNFIRLNLSSIGDLKEMLVTKAKEFYGITIENLRFRLSFGQISNSHANPINGVRNWSEEHKNLPRWYLGWGGQIIAKVTVPNLSKYASGSASDCLFRYRGFKGFHTLGGCPGSVIGEYEMDIGFCFFLDDFPILKEKYENYLVGKEIQVRNLEIEDQYEESKQSHVSSDDKIVQVQNQIQVLGEELQKLFEQKGKEFCANNPLSDRLLPIPDNYDSLKSDLFIDGYDI